MGKENENQRKKLVELMKAEGTIKSYEVEKAFLKTRREIFMPKEMEKQSYHDNAFSIGHGQTISQPSTIAIMLEMLSAKKGQKAGEIGSGCGYVTALLSCIVGGRGKVIGTEIIKELAEVSRKNLQKQGCKNAEIIEGDGVELLFEKRPFDRIIVSAACPFIPKKLFDCLNENGKIVAPTGDMFLQSMTSLEKVNGSPVKKQYERGHFVFVPLRGKHGY